MSSKRGRNQQADDDYDYERADHNQLLGRHNMHQITLLCLCAAVITLVGLAGFNTHEINELEAHHYARKREHEDMMYKQDAMNEKLDQIIEMLTVPFLVRSEHGIPIGPSFGSFLEQYATDTALVPCADTDNPTPGCIIYETFLQYLNARRRGVGEDDIPDFPITA